MQPRYLLAAVLLLLLTLAPLTGWPGHAMSAYAQASGEQGPSVPRVRAHWWPLSLFTVSASNENERKEQEERRGREDNQSHDDNDDDCCAPPPAPPPPPRQQAPLPPQNQASACLGSGGSVSLGLSDGTVTMKVFQDNLNVELSRNDLPPGPGGLLGNLIFRVSASSCGGGGMGSLPGEGNLGVSYIRGVAAGKNESQLKLMYWDGQRWSEAPKQATDPGNNYVSATISALGVYALTAP